MLYWSVKRNTNRDWERCRDTYGTYNLKYITCR